MGICSPGGFVAAGGHCGIKDDGFADMAVVSTTDGRPVPAAAVFTSNLATAAPVQVTRRHLEATNGQAAAVVINSGNANAATGAQGRTDAERMCALVAEQLGCRAEEVLVCSTGLIGIPLPMAPIETGIAPVAAALSADGGTAASTAIMTTDTKRKEVVVRGAGFTVGGMAKGAAMLAPNMATMLAVLTTDAVVHPADLRLAVEGSFHRLTVDGCTSTNDTVIVLSTGAVPAAGVEVALAEACRELAEAMAEDAEGATKVVTVTVTGAASDGDAAIAARKIAESELCKCSWYGQDPYWGRIVSELGSAGVAFDPDTVSVTYGTITVARAGVACHHDAAALKDVMAARRLQLTADLGIGDGHGFVITNDLTHAYIDENMGTS
jgi:glutamate N-acetyltransferase/amino-acid N-acetyltransferase